MPVDTTRTWRATRPTRRPTVDLCAAPRAFFTNPQALTAHSHPDFFSRTITRCSTLETSARDTNIMTLLYHPHPIRQSAPTLRVPTESPSTRRRIRKSCPLYAGGSPCFPSIPRASICVTCASMVRRDEIPLDEGSVLICCDMYVCRRRLQNSLRRDDSK